MLGLLAILILSAGSEVNQIDTDKRKKSVHCLWLNAAAHMWSYAAHDLWRARGGLGKAAAAVYWLMEGLTAEEIARARGGKVPAVRKHLRKLFDHSLAFRDSDGRWHRSAKELDDAARELPAWGEGHRQKERHRDDRLAFRATLSVADSRSSTNPPARF